MKSLVLGAPPKMRPQAPISGFTAAHASTPIRSRDFLSQRFLAIARGVKKKDQHAVITRELGRPSLRSFRHQTARPTAALLHDVPYLRTKATTIARAGTAFCLVANHPFAAARNASAATNAPRRPTTTAETRCA